MKNLDSNISYHITGNYPLRDLSAEERDEPRFIVHFPRGFETLDIAVYGHGLCESDACEAACEYLQKSNALGEQDEENCFCS